MTIIVSDQQTFHEVAEFIPPDRMRMITTIGAPGYGTAETIRIGERAWSNESGWREWEPGDAQRIFGAGMDFSLLPDRAVTADDKFHCLGNVEFKGTAYIGYRTKLAKSFSVMGTLSDEQRQKLLSELAQMPQEWRTVFVDGQSGLPTYDITAAESQLDHPRHGTQYTYPDDAAIKIDQPVQ